MLTPPFKRSAGVAAAMDATSPRGPQATAAGGCGHEHASPEGGAGTQPRAKLHHLDPHLHCSVIGTCLGTDELRRLMARHTPVKGLDDLEVHHLAVSLAARGGDASKAIHKALDQRHAGTLRSFAGATDEAALRAAWRQAWQQGEIPGAYWAILTHRGTTPELRQQAFGEVHMLSHLMGSANRQEIRRFVALEKDNTELRERLEREQSRRQEAQQARDALAEDLRNQALAFEARLAEAKAALPGRAQAADAAELVAVHTQRRERAERSAEEAGQALERQRLQLERAQQQAQTLSEELAAAEAELQRLSSPTSPGATGAAAPHPLQGRKLLYVGGRPSSTPAIRDFVQRHGGEFLHHDGGLEARKGMLAALLPRADVVVFPVDCVDHDSVLNLKRLSERHRVPFMALRTASLGSFAAAIAREAGPPATDGASRFCLRHG
ncbi:DUF2325 domain-containing protein [Roseateles sp.]|uniref:DUF2325 domain-containing protein n=1 Tax=Roseateles sp. TaxID=1971397 RepID=UPI0039E7F3C6